LDNNPGGIDIDDPDEWINDYYNGLMLLDEQLQTKLQMIK